jgi:hypothetical protein
MEIPYPICGKLDRYQAQHENYRKDHQSGKVLVV